MSATPAQKGLIHSLAKQAGMTEAERRGLIEQVAGVRSSADLSAAQAGRVIDHLKALTTKPTPAAGAVRLDGAYAGKVRALWITAYQLGVVRDRTDRALLAFIERQTGISHTRWLRDAGDARKVIEALKSWIERESGWVWLATDSPEAQARAIIRAQWHRLVESGMKVHAGRADWALDDYAGAVLDRYRQAVSVDRLTLAEAQRVIAALARKLHAGATPARKGAAA